MALKFINPFNGTPTKIQLTGLFLFHPQTYLDIGGESISGTFKLLGKESLLKRLEAIGPGDKVPPERLSNLITELLDAGNASDNLRRRFLGQIEIAIEEEEMGAPHPASIGQYESVIAAFNPNEQKLGAPQEFFLDMEKRSRAALSHAYKQRFSETVQLILEEEFFAPFLWDGVRAALGRVKDDGSLLLLRISIAMEVFLAGMVIYESSYERAKGKKDPSCLLDVWPIAGQKAKNPFGMLFEWTKGESGARTQREFFDHPKLQNVDMDLVRLKRWSSGTHQPRKEWLDEVAMGLWGNANHPAFQMRLAFAQQVNFIGHCSQLLISRLPKELSENQQREAYPWPKFPHEYVDFASWGRSRYQFWRDYARDYRAKFE